MPDHRPRATPRPPSPHPAPPMHTQLLRLGALRGLQRLSLESTFLDDEGAVSIASSIRQADMRALEVSAAASARRLYCALAPRPTDPGL
jgi:hypothetical protein